MGVQLVAGTPLLVRCAATSPAGVGHVIWMAVKETLAGGEGARPHPEGRRERRGSSVDLALDAADMLLKLD